MIRVPHLDARRRRANEMGHPAYSCIEGCSSSGFCAVSSNIGDDPGFANPGSENLHISPDSPCIDAADNTVVPSGITTDLDGQNRFIDDPETPPTGFPHGEEVLVDIGETGETGTLPFD